MRNIDLISNSFNEEVNKNARRMRQDIRTCAPATVISTKDYEKHQCLSIELSIQDIHTWKDSTVLRATKLEKVFVDLPRFGGWVFRFPVKVGDKVTVWWSDKDLSRFLDNTGVNVEQSVGEVGEIEDCWIELGFGTRKNHNNPDLLNLEIEGPNTKLTITPEGNITTSTKGNITATAEGTYDITASHLTIHNNTTITSNLLVKGTTTSKGVVNADGGVHASTYAGTGGGAASFAVDMGINGIVTINGTVVNTHTHIDSVGGNTGTPQ